MIVTGAARGMGASHARALWGLRGLTKCAAMEMAHDNIRVNSVHPGITMTPMLGDRVEQLVGFANTLAIPRPGDPTEITRLVFVRRLR